MKEKIIFKIGLTAGAVGVVSLSVFGGGFVSGLQELDKDELNNKARTKAEEISIVYSLTAPIFNRGYDLGYKIRK